MNSRGFTLIELITTFALSTVIIILLINIILVIKNIYSKNEVKTELIIEQSNLSNLINKKFYMGALHSYEPCDATSDDFCYIFNFNDGTSSMINIDDNKIKFDNYIYKAKKGITIEEATIEIFDIDVSSEEVNNSILVIKIPIKHKLYPNEDFGINIVYQYNSIETTL